jgi:tetratricopeptide (TPR) repeat protein
VSAGERALGERYIEENAGHFWGLLETRPYMRALEGKARCLWGMRQKEEALGVYREILRLNPGDNQGIRYVLVDLYLTLNRGAELEKLIGEYAGDWSAVWLYTQALLAFQKNGPSPIADRKLRQAVDENSHVIAYLTGKKRIAHRLPDAITLGGDSEALDYASAHLNYWRRTPGAVEWLLSPKAGGQKKTPRAGTRGRKRRAA